MALVLVGDGVIGFGMYDCARTGAGGVREPQLLLEIDLGVL